MPQDSHDFPRHWRYAPWIFTVSTLVVLALSFGCARFIGIQDGQRAARIKIEQENDLTAGPSSLIP